MPSNHTTNLPQLKLTDTQEKPVREELSQSRLKSLLHYDPSTGVFTWRISTGNGVRPREIAGSKNANGYIRIKVNTIHYLAHRLAWLYIYGTWPGEQIDHINGDRADNRLCNLREATRTENMQNRRAKTNSKTGYLGAAHNKSRYQSRITLDGTAVYLGTFDTPEEAHQAYLAAKAKFHKFQPTPRAE